MSDKHPYIFESESRTSTVRRPEQAEAEMKRFAARLEIPDDTADYAPILTRYVVDIHLNILWYMRRLKRERWWRRLFITGTIILLPAVPLLIWLLSSQSDDGGWSAAELTALITGILAIHKTVAAWLDKRQLFSHFWRASSDLKEMLYAFELDWKGRATDNGALRREFVDAVGMDLTRARQIVREERDHFYQLYSYPSVDVFHKLQETFTQSKQLVDQFQSSGMVQRRARVEAEAARAKQLDDAHRRLRAAQANVAGLEAQLREQEQALAELADTASPDARMRFEQSLATLQAAVDQARQDEIRIQGEVESLK